MFGILYSICKQVVLEALTPKQVAKAKEAEALRKITDFGPVFKEQRTYFPFEAKEAVSKEVVPVSVMGLTKKLGYDNIDYKNGLVWRSATPNKKLKLGRIIQQNAPELLKDYNERLKGGAKHLEKLLIVVTHKPEDIAGMSTDRNWTSCTTLVGGRYKSASLEKIKFGGMVSYLIKESDKNIDDPLARISIRRFSSESGNFMFKQEDKCYSAVQVEGWDLALEKILEDSNKKTRGDSHVFADAEGSEYSDTFRGNSNIIYGDLSDASEVEQLAAVKQEDRAIQFIKNPSEALQLAVVKWSGSVIYYIKNPSEAVKLAAVKQNGLAIEFIKNPSETVQLAAVEQNGYAIQFIKNPSEVVKLAAVTQRGRAIGHIDNPSEAVQLAAVKQDGLVIQFIKNPSEAVKLAAVTQNGFAIQFIKNPSEAVQLAAVKQNGRAIELIKNPFPSVLAYIKSKKGK